MVPLAIRSAASLNETCWVRQIVPLWIPSKMWHIFHPKGSFHYQEHEKGSHPSAAARWPWCGWKRSRMQDVPIQTHHLILWRGAASSHRRKWYRTSSTNRKHRDGCQLSSTQRRCHPATWHRYAQWRLTSPECLQGVEKSKECEWLLEVLR